MCKCKMGHPGRRQGTQQERGIKRGWALEGGRENKNTHERTSARPAEAAFRSALISLSRAAAVVAATCNAGVQSRKEQKGRRQSASERAI